MIKGIFIINNHGQVRIGRYFTTMTLERQEAVARFIYRSVSSRPDHLCNYLEVVDDDMGKYKIVYRHYVSAFVSVSVRENSSFSLMRAELHALFFQATLYFIFVVDSTESDLGILDLIQVFVEVLDKCFENVCELDIIFHSDKVNFVLDEIVTGGMVLETNVTNIIQAVHEQQKLHKKSEAMQIGPSVADAGNMVINAVEKLTAEKNDRKF